MVVLSWPTWCVCCYVFSYQGDFLSDFLQDQSFVSVWLLQQRGNKQMNYDKVRLIYLVLLHEAMEQQQEPYAIQAHKYILAILCDVRCIYIYTVSYSYILLLCYQLAASDLSHVHFGSEP